MEDFKKRVLENKLVAIAYSGLLISILSAFTTIIGYTNKMGQHHAFSLLDFLSDADLIGSFVFKEYTGTVYVQFEGEKVLLLVFLGAVAIFCAFSGLNRLSKQTDNTISFVLTLFGLIGTMIPSLAILFLVAALKDYYLGAISYGIYPIVSPIAMIVCIAAATQMRRKNNEYREKLKETEGLMFMGGDL